MIVLPAIDILDGKPVRLYQGDYGQSKCVADDVLVCAKNFEAANACYLHVVDLDGAKDGLAKNLETIKAIRKSTQMKIELGGGIRDLKTVQLYLDEVGIDRVILGTAALKDPQFLKDVLKQYGNEKIVVGVDVKNGYVSTAGWLETSQMPYLEFIQYLQSIGVKYIVATDISKDGTLTGPNFEMYDQIAKSSSIQFVVSGGIKDFDNIKKVAEKGYYACIVGKAYYEKKIDLKETIQCLQNV